MYGCHGDRTSVWAQKSDRELVRACTQAYLVEYCEMMRASSAAKLRLTYRRSWDSSQTVRRPPESRFCVYLELGSGMAAEIGVATTSIYDRVS